MPRTRRDRRPPTRTAARARARAAAGRRAARVGEHAGDAVGDGARRRRDRPARRRRRPLRAATRRSRSRPACRWPSPRAAAGRSLRRATGTRTPRPAGRGRASVSSGTIAEEADVACAACGGARRGAASAYFEISSPMISSFSVIEAARVQVVERLDQPLEVLVRLDVAGVEHERLVQLVALADARDVLVRRRLARSARRWRCR